MEPITLPGTGVSINVVALYGRKDFDDSLLSGASAWILREARSILKLSLLALEAIVSYALQL